MDQISSRISGSDAPVTLYIGGATYDPKHDYNGLTERLEGTHIVTNNPFHTEQRRPKDWEQELVGGLEEICHKEGVTQVIAHSRGCLQALMLRDRMTFERMVLLHPPVRQCRMSTRKRLNLVGDMDKLDELLAQTCEGMSDDQYRQFIEHHYYSYGHSTGKLMNILRYDAANIPVEEVQARIAKMDEDEATKYLVIAGRQDPWDDPSVKLNRQTHIMLEDQGHFSQISMADELSLMIKQWRNDQPVVMKKTEPRFAPLGFENPIEEAEEIIGGF